LSKSVYIKVPADAKIGQEGPSLAGMGKKKKGPGAHGGAVAGVSSTGATRYASELKKRSGKGKGGGTKSSRHKSAQRLYISKAAEPVEQASTKPKEPKEPHTKPDNKPTLIGTRNSRYPAQAGAAAGASLSNVSNPYGVIPKAAGAIYAIGRSAGGEKKAAGGEKKAADGAGGGEGTGDEAESTTKPVEHTHSKPDLSPGVTKPVSTPKNSGIKVPGSSYENPKTISTNAPPPVSLSGSSNTKPNIFVRDPLSGGQGYSANKLTVPTVPGVATNENKDTPSPKFERKNYMKNKSLTEDEEVEKAIPNEVKGPMDIDLDGQTHRVLGSYTNINGELCYAVAHKKHGLVQMKADRVPSDMAKGLMPVIDAALYKAGSLPTDDSDTERLSGKNHMGEGGGWPSQSHDSTKRRIMARMAPKKGR